MGSILSRERKKEMPIDTKKIPCDNIKAGNVTGINTGNEIQSKIDDDEKTHSDD
jgi:hypothetical protein